MSRFATLLKLWRLASRPRFATAAARHRVAAAVEHIAPVKLCNAATLIDIGANKGQFSLLYRQFAPDGTIIAFEPFPESAARFEGLFEGDAAVTLHRVALAESAGETQFYITDRADSSSLLKPGSGQTEAYGVATSSMIDVPVRRLDALVDMAACRHPVMVKIDVQGAELKVLQGCADLERADYLYIELSYVTLYEGQPLFDEVATYLFERGFTLAGVFNQSTTARFGPTQADVLFRRGSA